MWGADTIVPNHGFYEADLTITLCDPFGFWQDPRELRKISVAHWFPVDCSPVGQTDIGVLREGGGIPIAMSRFGEKMLSDEGAFPCYVPHAVDTQVFCPGSQEDFRATTPAGSDTFIVGICAMNRDHVRKGWGEQFEAFAMFHANHPDSFLAVHSADVNPKGLNLRQLALRLGIAGAVLFPDSYPYSMNMISREQLAIWYRGLDVLSLCSYGEGFGLPLIEAQACGVPVVTTNASAMAELCGAGWLVSGTRFWTPTHNAWWTRPDVTDIYNAYEHAWQAKKEGRLPGEQAREFAMLFDADRVARQFWGPVLDAIAERIG